MTDDKPAQETSSKLVLEAAKDLRAIDDLSTYLESQAVHRSADPDMPGGLAMVMLAPVANHEAASHLRDYVEQKWFDDPETTEADRPDLSHEDVDWQPPLQTLTYWSERWREARGHVSDLRPTISSEVQFLRDCLDWASQQQPRFGEFVRDIRQARRQVENTLRAGKRAERGVPCMYDECGGARLLRTIDNDGDRSDWFCPQCARTWDDEAYWRNVGAANARIQYEEINGEAWSTYEYAARATGRPVRTLYNWADSGHVRRACMIAGRRTKFISLDDVRARTTPLHARAEDN